VSGVTSEKSEFRDAAEIDRQLVYAIAAGSDEALGQLYDRFASTAYGIARRILGQADQSEEVVQDVFTQVWREAARYDKTRATVAGWIVMLARARSIDRLRARSSRPDQWAGADPASVPQAVSPGASPEAATMSAEDASLVRGALTNLPAQQRMIVDLAYYEGLSHSEIAAKTGMPLGTVKTRMRSALTAMREVLSS
jgi:RNA polymerase sigma-70 factor (ECF subfamily)